MDSHYVDVMGVLTHYLDGLYNSDTSRLSQAFHPMAHYVCVTDGTFLHLTMDEYFPIVDQRPSPASRNEPHHDRIISIEFAGPATALARVECVMGPKHFTEFITFIFINERWQIISKVFHYDLLK